MNNHRDKLRRLRVLQQLQQTAPNPMGELALVNGLRADPELEPTIELVRGTLRYLYDYNLIKLVNVPKTDWVAGRITDDGLRWLESSNEAGFDIYTLGELPEPANDNRHGRVSSVETLPAEVKAWLDQELVRLGFRNYTDLTKVLTGQGYQISRSAVGRYGKTLKARVKQQKEKAQVIRSLADVFENDAPAIMQGAMGSALTAVMDAIQEGEYASGKDTLSKLVGVLPKLGQGFRQAEQHKIERETRRKTVEEAADQVEEVARAQGLDNDQARFWREKFLKGM
ncbi:MAG: phage protein Gp27 family protein [Candidatus Sedimenticola sp. (ex Thyasira tokunagai)]